MPLTSVQFIQLTYDHIDFIHRNHPASPIAISQSPCLQNIRALIRDQCVASISVLAAIHLCSLLHLFHESPCHTYRQCYTHSSTCSPICSTNKGLHQKAAMKHVDPNNKFEISTCSKSDIREHRIQTKRTCNIHLPPFPLYKEDFYL
mmetsp:Transcript_41217/g.82000  ORF Transcript_41217/g.82000 Transcript_41217/m.82000 type:complete len:147 (-) Transcript_41217:16-456(-)